MSENKCCGNCKHLEDEGVDGFGFCVVFKCIHHCTGGGRCVAHQFNDNGWTEITPDNEEEVYNLEPDRIVIANIVNGLIFYTPLFDMPIPISIMAKSGGYYYYELPELKIKEVCD